MFKMIHQFRQRGRRWSRISLTVSRPLLPSGGCLEAATRMTEWPRRDHSDVSRKHDTAVSGDTSHSQTRHARPDTWGAVSRVHLRILTTADPSINHQCLKLSCYVRQVIHFFTGNSSRALDTRKLTISLKKSATNTILGLKSRKVRSRSKQFKH